MVHYLGIMLTTECEFMKPIAEEVGITNIRVDRLEYTVLPLESFENTAEDCLQLILSLIGKFFLGLFALVR